MWVMISQGKKKLSITCNVSEIKEDLFSATEVQKLKRLFVFYILYLWPVDNSVIILPSTVFAQTKHRSLTRSSCQFEYSHVTNSAAKLNRFSFFPSRSWDAHCDSKAHLLPSANSPWLEWRTVAVNSWELCLVRNQLISIHFHVICDSIIILFISINMKTIKF